MNELNSGFNIAPNPHSTENRNAEIRLGQRNVDLRSEYDALKESAGLLDLSSFGVMVVEGPERVAWLNKLTTVNVPALETGTGRYGLLLNSTGHVTADFTVLARNNSLLLYTGPQAKEKLSAQLRRRIFREKVKLSEVIDYPVVLSLQGRLASFLLEQVVGTLPELAPLQFVEIDQGIVVRNARFGNDGYDLISAKERFADLAEALVGAGARRVGTAAFTVARVEAGVPWFGDDFDEATLAPEARLDDSIAENKGCYTGQEVIARIRNRGHVNRLLCRISIAEDLVPDRGDVIYADGNEVGWITSAVWSFEHSSPLALGYLRRELAQPGSRVQIIHHEKHIAAEVN